MKNANRVTGIISLLVLVHLTILFVQPVNAQEVVTENCFDDIVLEKIDSIKKKQADAGFLLLNEAVFNMESGEEKTIMLPLSKSIFYQFVVIGEQSSKTIEMSMYDWNENEVFTQQKQNAHSGINMLAVSYIPKETGYFLIKPMQLNRQKKKNLCGHILLFKKV